MPKNPVFLEIFKTQTQLGLFDSYPRMLDVPEITKTPVKTMPEVTLMGSGAIRTEAIKAARQLADRGIRATVYSVSSWSELARDGSHGPVTAATDYVRAVPESIRAFLPAGGSYLTLGTDGFGRSDTRAALRQFFGVDAQSIVTAALWPLDAAQV